MRKVILHITLIFGIFFSGYSQADTEREQYFSALAEYRQQNYSRAIDFLEESQHPAFIEFRGKIYYKTEKYSSAIQEYNRLIEHYPSKAFFALSKIYAQMGYEAESMHYLEKHFEYRNPKSMAEIDMNPAFEVIQNTTEWRQFWQTPRYSSNQQQIHEANYLINQKRNTEAINILYNLQRGSVAAQSGYLLSIAYYNMGNINNSLVNINEAIRRDRNNLLYLEHKFILLMEAGNDLEAASIANSLVKLDKFNPKYLVKRARVENNLGNYDSAINDLEFYLRFFPDDENALYYLAIVYANNEQLVDAIKQYNKLIEINPSKPEYFIGRADIYYYFEQWNFASKDYAMALDIDPFQPEVHYRLGWCRFKTNSYEKACRSWHHAQRMRHREAAKTIHQNCRR